MRCFDGTGSLTDIQIRIALENVACVKRGTVERNAHKVCNDLRRELMMVENMSQCDIVVMMTGNLSRYLL